LTLKTKTKNTWNITETKYWRNNSS